MSQRTAPEISVRPAPLLELASLSELKARTAEPSLSLPWERDIVALRRDFHEHPELGYEETRTAGIVAARLRELGLEVREGVGGTGVVATLSNGEGPTILVRADMDALPIEEQNGWEWRSSSPGKMHACGHDCHTAIGLTVARLLVEELDRDRSSWHGTVKWMFQPAEEGGNGAGRMIEDGLLDPMPDAALALHVWSDVPAGQVALREGASMACADVFRARISGRGGHGAIPQQTIDPVVVAAHVVTALQTVVSRSVDPLEPAVVTVGQLSAGEAFNVIPDEATLSGTVRAFNEETRAVIEKRVREVIETLPLAFGARGACAYEKGYPPTVNDTRLTQWTREAIAEEIGAENVVEWTPTMGAEDMSLVLERVPGCYFFVGGRNEEIGAVYPHHHPKFNVDERCLEIGARSMAAAIRKCLSLLSLLAS
jgi:amidohydrolase